MVDALQTQIAIIDSGGIVLSTNRAWRECAEAGGEDNDRLADGANYLAYCDEIAGARRESRNATMAAGIRSIARGAEKEFSIEYAMQVKGERRWFSVRITRFPGDGPVRLVVSHEDISRRKSAEEEVNKTREEAELANLAKSAFLANTSHEIRTPMNAILGYAEMLLDPNQTESQRQNSARTIRRNGEHLLAIINDILDISKIEAQKLTVEKLPCDLQQLVTDLIGLTRPWAEKKGLRFEIEFDKIIPKQVQTDPLRAKQVLVNLVGNAIKFTESGRIKIGIYREISYFSHTIRFEVTDTGIGMTPPPDGKAFPAVLAGGCFDDSPLRWNRPRADHQQATGQIAWRRYYRQVRARLWQHFHLFTRLDGGPRLGVPLVENLYDGYQLSVGEVEIKDEDIKINGSILLAEDGEDNRELVMSHLRGAGAQVAIATTGRLAVDACKTQIRFDPDGHADARTRWIRRLPGAALAGNPRADHRPHGQCHGRRPPQVHGSGLHGLSFQADRTKRTPADAGQVP